MKQFKAAGDIFCGKKGQDYAYIEASALLWHLHLQMK